MKKSNLYIALTAVLILAGCSLFNLYSFEDALKDIEVIDSKYGTSMYEERLDRVMLNIEDVEGMLNDLDAMELRLKNMGNSEDVKAALLLVDFRKNMLESELDMIKVRHIGAKGQIMDGFACKDKEYILNASLLMKSAVHKGASALSIFDKLTEFVVTSEHINRDKLEFDKSDVKELLSQADQGISIGKSNGFCDEEEENTEDE
ncbi:hypothetical protein ACFLZ6_00260 [Nanoarchaeota archaeon]